MKVHILELKPTQLAIGMQEVTAKVEHISEMSDRARKKFVKTHPITVAIAPNRQMYILDGHHHTAACWQAGVKKLFVRIEHDFRLARVKLSYEKFWAVMREKNWCHLYDKYGDGPRDPMYLAHDIRGLGDDPYRSLAWMVRRAGGYQHTDQPFSEFHWANFFRRREVFVRNFDLDYEKATKAGLRLARSPMARKLPGYLGV